MKKMKSMLLVIALMLSAGQTVFAWESNVRTEAQDNGDIRPETKESAGQTEQTGTQTGTDTGSSDAQLIIEQIYGGGGKGETPISNSFVELYSLADTDIDLTEYTLSDGTYTLSLTGTIPANGSYLIIGAAEETTDEFLTYDLPQADQS
ncbi:MAG: lamin tail domain-containing protein, partial [Eubacteriales bacterium]